MNLQDIFFVFQWWGTLGILGLLFLPFTTVVFSQFYDKGFIFSKLFAIIAVSYFVFFAGIIHIIPFTQSSIILSTIFLAVCSLIPYFSIYDKVILVKKSFIASCFLRWRIFILEEVIFLVALFFWTYIRSFQPDIQGLEKFMDFGFINTILRSTYFPPADMWFTPFSINYYYFGHLYAAVLIKLSHIPSPVGYNLMIATIFAFCFNQAFSIGFNLVQHLSQEKHFFKRPLQLPFSLFAGFFSACLITVGGNLHTMYTLFKAYPNENPVPFWQLPLLPLSFPNSYWYPNATRFIHNTIHEFPIYSFVVSDLHGHVLSIPLVLTITALILHELLKMKSGVDGKKIILFALLIACAYMTNAWDGAIYIMLTSFYIFAATINWNFFFEKPKGYKQSVRKLFLETKHHFTIILFFVGLLILGFILFSLPFSLYFKPFVSGIGILCSPDFLTKIGKIGPFLFEENHCQKSPLWQIFLLYGFFYFWVVSFFIILRKVKKFYNTDGFILLLIILSTILIILPEFIYFKDIYPSHYRANTMFKLGYQAFILLSIVSSYIFFRLKPFIKWKGFAKNVLFKVIFLFVSISLLTIVFIYPYFAITSYYGNLQSPQSLDGMRFLQRLYPNDYEAIRWLNKNVSGQPVILEAQGDSYTDYARVSAFTGLPTVLGWTVHEWLWRGTYDIPAPRIADVETLYETTDIKTAQQLIDSYNISLVFVGDLERQKYELLYEEKFQQLGYVLFEHDTTRIYSMRN